MKLRIKCNECGLMLTMESKDSVCLSQCPKCGSSSLAAFSGFVGRQAAYIATIAVIVIVALIAAYSQHQSGKRNSSDDGLHYWSSIEKLTAVAEHGNLEAQRYLGGRFYNGDGVAKDKLEAAKWFSMAAEHGTEQDRTNLVTLKDEIAKATDISVKQESFIPVEEVDAADENQVRTNLSKGNAFDEVFEKDKRTESATPAKYQRWLDKIDAIDREEKSAFDAMVKQEEAAYYADKQLQAIQENTRAVEELARENRKRAEEEKKAQQREEADRYYELMRKRR